MKLLEGLEKKGHHVYCDNYYTIPTLFYDLRTAGFGACGTLRLDRKRVPKRLKSKRKMIWGEVESVVKHGTLFLKWMDKRVVSMCSTIHSTSRMVSIERRSRRGSRGLEMIEKLECIIEYNKWMGGVELYDQLCCYYLFDHRTWKWWRRLFFHLFNTAIVNAYILYTESTQSSRKLSSWPNNCCRKLENLSLRHHQNLRLGVRQSQAPLDFLEDTSLRKSLPLPVDALVN